MPRQRSRLRTGVGLLLCAALLATGAAAFPDLFAALSNCVEHPSNQGLYGDHGGVVPDSTTGIVLSIDGVARSSVCPGSQVDVQVAFPEQRTRLALITTSVGSLSTAYNMTCPNRAVTPARIPVGTLATVLAVPCSAAGTQLQIRVTSSLSHAGELQSTSLTALVLPLAQCSTAESGACMPGGTSLDVPAQLVSIDAPAAPEGAIAAPTSAPGDVPPAAVPVPTTVGAQGETFVPLTPNAHATDATPRSVQQPGAAVVDAADSDGGVYGPYSVRPILPPDRSLWQVLHGLLMLLAFGFLLPLGVLLGRHKWMFGRNAATNRAMSSWFWLHVISQLLGFTAAAGGVVVAILGLGWRESPGLALYEPHKWMGVGVIAMVLLQLLISPMRPDLSSRSRGCWNSVHKSLGRVTILAGSANTILGALLVHDFKRVPYIYWLLPACVLAGSMAFLALLLEAFKQQMQRTYRYDPKTRAMLPVFEGHGPKHAARRSSGSGSSEPLAPAATAAAAGVGLGGAMPPLAAAAAAAGRDSYAPTRDASPPSSVPDKAPSLHSLPEDSDTAAYYPPVLHSTDQEVKVVNVKPSGVAHL